MFIKRLRKIYTSIQYLAELTLTGVLLLERLSSLGIDPEGLESDGWYHAEAFISRPSEDCDGCGLAARLASQ